VRVNPENLRSVRRICSKLSPNSPTFVSRMSHRGASISRRAAAVAIVSLLGIAVGDVASAGPKAVPLFFIARSKNANIVRYDARLRAPDSFDPQQPIDAYWRMLATHGGREELSWLERKLAYGFEVSRITPMEVEIHLTAFSSRPVFVRVRGDRVRAEARIAGHDAVLERIFVKSAETGVLPRVLWVEVYGTDTRTGRKVTEHVQP